jgi:hypothetical protein
MVNRDNITQDFQCTLITAYIPKGIHVVQSQLGQIPSLKNNDFNLGDRNNYMMVTPHRYMMKMIGKRPHIVSQPWIKKLMQSMMINMMNIPHFGRHQEVNPCVKLLFSCYHGGYICLDMCITVDPVLIHQIIGLSMQGPDP